MKAISGVELIRILKRRGYRIYLNRGKGDHAIVEHDDLGYPLTIPNSRRDLSKGLQGKLMKQTGLRDSDL